MTIDYCTGKLREFLVIFIKQEWLLANFVKGVENRLQSEQYKFGGDCTFHRFLEHPNGISLSTMTIFHAHPRRDKGSN